MVRAYKLEQAACVPMIALTPELFKYLSEHPDRKYYSEDIDPIRTTLIRSENLPNGTTQWFINYLRVCLHSVEPAITPEARERYRDEDEEGRERIRSELWLNACREWAREHGKAILSAHAAAGSESVREKYKWLATYHNDEIKQFFGQEAEKLMIEP
jgi:hypothetical protein